jgi:low affinity Fe/Cu permease
MDGTRMMDPIRAEEQVTVAVAVTVTVILLHFFLNGTAYFISRGAY